MKINEVLCKSALSYSRLPGYRYALNPYRGCGHGCIYCYAPAVLREERRWGTFVDVKRNFPAVLSKELKKKKEGVVGIGTVTDAYQPIERKYQITRMSLEQLLKVDFPICIQTKSDLVLRDLDLISRFSDIEIGFTIAFHNENYRRLFEPNASSIESRISALKTLTKEGMSTWAFVGPILPHISRNELVELANTLNGTGVERVIIDKLNLKKGTWSNILQGIRNKDRGLHRTYLNISRTVDRYRRLGRILKERLESLGIECEFAF